MSEKFRKKYRIQSARAQWWNYGWNGAYFITIVTQHRRHFFGEIENGVMNTSFTGKLAHYYWYDIPNQFPYAELGEFIVMPNHIHGILFINKNGHEDVEKIAYVKNNEIL